MGGHASRSVSDGRYGASMSDLGVFAFRWVPSLSGIDAGVVFDQAQGTIHPGACDWLRSLSESGASPNTVRNYGLRVAGFLSWQQQQRGRREDVAGDHRTAKTRAESA